MFILVDVQRIKQIAAILKCLQWTKNSLLFIPAFFAAVDWTPTLIFQLSLAFIAFSCVASAVYVVNDWKDYFYDLQHPNKQNKPNHISIALNKVILLSVSLLLIGFGLSFYLGTKVLIYTLIYWLINLAYTFFLKKIPLLDLLPLILGYQLRLLIGGEIANGPPSVWLISIILVISLVLLVQKRQFEVLFYLESEIILRPTIPFYVRLPLAQIIKVLYSLIALLYLSYCLFILQQDNQKWIILLTVPLVFACLYYFWKLSKVYLFKDALQLYFTNWLMMLSTFVWLLIFYIALYP